MNNKGQMQMIGGIIMLAMAIIVGVILLQGSAQNIDHVVNTRTVSNMVIDTPANGTAYLFTGYKSVASVVVTNTTDGIAISAGNYTIANNQIVNGVLVATLTPQAGPTFRNPSDWNVSFTGTPVEYGDSGARSMSNLIILLMAVALIVIASVYAIKNYQS